jgi:2,3-dihydroxybenzoate decarboxylase
MLLGHLDRMDHWLEKRDRGRGLPSQKRLREYFETNIFITTAGTFSTTVLLHAMAEIGASRIIFSVDHPYENFTEAATWLDTAPINRPDRESIGYTNARRLFPKIDALLRTASLDPLQQNRESVLFTTNAGFE